LDDLRHLHDLVGITTLLDQARHGFHRFVDVEEVRPVAGTEVVQPVLAVGRADETVARALALAGKQHRALLAILRQRVVLALPEASLFF
jgi:hypothetical protein